MLYESSFVIVDIGVFSDAVLAFPNAIFFLSRSIRNCIGLSLLRGLKRIAIMLTVSRTSINRYVIKSMLIIILLYADPGIYLLSKL